MRYPMKIRKISVALFFTLTLILSMTACQKKSSDEQVSQPIRMGVESINPVKDSSDFVMAADVVPDVIQEIRYYTTYNFVGKRIDGYDAPVALMTKEAADALKVASEAFLEDGYCIKIYDAYRPQKAVDCFEEWAKDLEDTKMKTFFYPGEKKEDLFDDKYIVAKSGHSRGSTVDMTVVNMTTGKELDMGSHFDFFGEISHHNSKLVTPEQSMNRQYIRKVMEESGFVYYPEEWWHYMLKDEPYPDTYFEFPVDTLTKEVYF